MVNTAIIVGKLVEPFTPVENTNRSETKILVKTNKEMLLPVSIDSRTIVASKVIVGERVHIIGTIRSWSEHTSDGKRHNHVHIHASSIDCALDNEQDQSYVHFQGRMVTVPYRTIKNGKVISQTIVRIRFAAGRYYYIPIVAWSASANYVTTLKVKQDIDVIGSFISRQYNKYTNNVAHQYTTYEVVISRVIPIEGEENV